jgi:hypothetical protein
MQGSAYLSPHAGRARRDPGRAPAAAEQRNTADKTYSGNQAALRRFSTIQCKLAVGSVNDPLEAEADRAADRVMRMTDPALSGAGRSQQVRRYRDHEEEEKKLQRKSDGRAQAAGHAPPIVRRALNRPGQPLDPATRAFFEPRFGAGLQDVRIHNDEEAGRSVRSIHALAYAQGADIVIAPEQYRPATPEGKRLLAHELAHTLQHFSGAIHRQLNPEPESDDYAQGYKDGLSGAPSNPGPRNVEALDDYNNGYAKGQEASPTAAGPSPGATTQPGADAGAPAKTDAPAQAGAPTAQPQQSPTQGSWYEQKKWEIYRGIIAAAKQTNKASSAAMRGQVGRLPQGLQEAARTVIDVIDTVNDMCMALMLAIIGLAVGFVEGIAGMIVGVLKLLAGLVKLVSDWLWALMGKPDDYMKDVASIVDTVKKIPSGIKATIDAWWDRYKNAPAEEQVIMGTELVGQLEAFIASFAFAGAKAGQGGNLAVNAVKDTIQSVQGGNLALAGATSTGKILAPAVSSGGGAVAATSTDAISTVSQMAGQAPVVASQAMTMSGQGPGSSGGGGPLHDVTDEEIEKAVSDPKASGDPVEMERHGQASTARKQKGLTGEMQSAHVTPRSTMRKVPGYDPDDAFTTLLKSDVHRSMDAYWKSQFQAMQAAGKSTATAQEVYDVVAQSIRQAVGITDGTKASLIARLQDELFIELQLKPTDVVELPYAR